MSTVTRTVSLDISGFLSRQGKIQRLQINGGSRRAVTTVNFDQTHRHLPLLQRCHHILLQLRRNNVISTRRDHSDVNIFREIIKILEKALFPVSSGSLLGSTAKGCNQSRLDHGMMRGAIKIRQIAGSLDTDYTYNFLFDVRRRLFGIRKRRAAAHGSSHHDDALNWKLGADLTDILTDIGHGKIAAPR